MSFVSNFAPMPWKPETTVKTKLETDSTTSGVSSGNAETGWKRTPRQDWKRDAEKRGLRFHPLKSRRYLALKSASRKPIKQT